MSDRILYLYNRIQELKAEVRELTDQLRKEGYTGLI